MAVSGEERERCGQLGVCGRDDGGIEAYATEDAFVDGVGLGHGGRDGGGGEGADAFPHAAH